ncbi:MAG: ABC transporter substrate-binding protein [Methylococcales bacterium]|nr:ABC transporter substrate-binding protein [Methylococcales bacterium]
MLINRQVLGYRLLLIIFIACLLGHQPDINAKPKKKHVSLQLRWYHQFQFAGYYAALEQGFYRQAGLEVSLIEGGLDRPYAIDQVLESNAEFGVSTSGLVLEYLRGKPVITLATIFQKSPATWLMRAESKIKSPSDFAGKSVNLFEDSTELKAMFAYDGIPLKKIQFQQNGEGIEELIAGSSSVIEAYVTNEPFILKQKGIKYRLIQPINYGIDFYGDNLFTHWQFLQDNPKIVKAFVEASLKGWEYAFKHEEEIIQLIHQRYAPQKSLEHLRYEAEEMRKLILPELIQLGHINPNRWQFIAKTFKKLGLTDQDSDLKSFIYQPKASVNFQKYIVPGILLVIFSLVGWFVVGWYIKINRRLKLALKEIKTLQGIIPICSYCHSILDEEGDWSELEAYMYKHSDATFSHGICPKCVPGIMKEISDLKTN